MFPSLAVDAQLRNWNEVPGCIVDNIPTLKCFEVVFGNILFTASSLILLVLFIMFFVGGFNYLTSLGNPEKVKKAQSTFRFAIIGLLIFMGSFLILKTIDYLFLGNCNKIFELNLQVTNAPVPCPP